MHAFRQKAQKNSRGNSPQTPILEGAPLPKPFQIPRFGDPVLYRPRLAGVLTLQLPVKVYPTVSYPPTPMVTHETRRKRIAAKAYRPNTRVAICKYKKLR